MTKYGTMTFIGFFTKSTVPSRQQKTVVYIDIFGKNNLSYFVFQQGDYVFFHCFKFIKHVQSI